MSTIRLARFNGSSMEADLSTGWFGSKACAIQCLQIDLLQGRLGRQSFDGCTTTASHLLAPISRGVGRHSAQVLCVCVLHVLTHQVYKAMVFCPPTLFQTATCNLLFSHTRSSPLHRPTRRRATHSSMPFPWTEDTFAQGAPQSSQTRVFAGEHFTVNGDYTETDCPLNVNFDSSAVRRSTGGNFIQAGIVKNIKGKHVSVNSPVTVKFTSGGGMHFGSAPGGYFNNASYHSSGISQESSPADYDNDRHRSHSFEQWQACGGGNNVYYNDFYQERAPSESQSWNSDQSEQRDLPPATEDANERAHLGQGRHYEDGYGAVFDTHGDETSQGPVSSASVQADIEHINLNAHTDAGAESWESCSEWEEIDRED
ncbi:hypothetical protein C8R47DRAFT_1117989 [Mycena vitilis]|nr:hypothetical protein C8R47DRAFT_1117989 [Mycena vitilis]